MVNIAGVDVPNTVHELTIEQFDKLNKINTEQLEGLDKWIKKFVYLGVPEEAFDDMTLEDFKTAVREFNEGAEDNDAIEYSVEIDGFTYTASEKIGVKDLSMIEKAWKADRSEFTAECIAILFKREDLSKNEHYSNSHIKHKKALFKKQKCAFAVPHIVKVSELLIQSVEKLNNESTEELE
jgi:hypothetical protein